MAAMTEWYGFMRFEKRAANIELHNMQRHNEREAVPENARADAPVRKIDLLVGEGHPFETLSYKQRVDFVLTGFAIPEGDRARAKPVVEVVMDASSEFFDAISPNWRNGELTQRMIKWCAACVEWAREKFNGALISAVLHLDETKPHLHVAGVPVYQRQKKVPGPKPKDIEARLRRDQEEANAPPVWTLSANHTFGGNKRRLRELQTEFHEKVSSQFGLLRGHPAEFGTDGTPRRRRSIQEHYREISRLEGEAEAQVKELEIERADLNANAKLVEEERRVVAAAKAQVEAERQQEQTRNQAFKRLLAAASRGQLQPGPDAGWRVLEGELELSDIKGDFTRVGEKFDRLFRAPLLQLRKKEEQLAAEAERLAAESKALSSERAMVTTERAQLAGDRQALTNREALLEVQQANLQAGTEAMSAERTALAMERVKLKEEREELTTQEDRLEGQKSYLSNEEARLTELWLQIEERDKTFEKLETIGQEIAEGRACVRQDPWYSIEIENIDSPERELIDEANRFDSDLYRSAQVFASVFKRAESRAAYESRHRMKEYIQALDSARKDLESHIPDLPKEPAAAAQSTVDNADLVKKRVSEKVTPAQRAYWAKVTGEQHGR